MAAAAALAFAVEPVVVGPVVVTAAGVMWVRIRTKQVTTLPPALPVPLHWLTVTGTAGLTTDSGATVQ